LDDTRVRRATFPRQGFGCSGGVAIVVVNLDVVKAATGGLGFVVEFVVGVVAPVRTGVV
jgi:hypothetical protein